MSEVLRTRTVRRAVRVGGRGVMVADAGTGRPEIILINGAGMPMEAWDRVFGDLAALARTVAYDRPGVGGSDPSPEGQSGDDVVRGLRALLAEIDVPPPYVLVGHSLGGLFANLYARRHPAEIAGIVFVDASHPSQVDAARSSGTRVARALHRVFAALDAVRRRAPLPEISSLPVTVQQIADAGPFPDIPLVVVTGTRSLPSWLVPRDEFERHLAGQRDLATLSPQGRQASADRSGHMVQLSQPDLVVQAVKDILGGRAAAGRRPSGRDGGLELVDADGSGLELGGAGLRIGRVDGQ